MKQTITITGGGLAGLALAIGLRRADVPVTVHEAGTYPRHRVCGEFISGVSIDTLENLGIAADLADAKLHHSVAWYEGNEWMRRDPIAVPARGISRWLLDARLVARLEQLGGTVVTGVREKPFPSEGRVWAAGRRPRRGGWLGLKCHFYQVPMQADLEMHLGSGGYVGLAGVEDDRINVCGLFRVNRAVKGTGSELLSAYLRHGKLWELAAMLEASPRDEGSFAAVSGFALGRQVPLPGLVTIGDADSMIPPFTGNGMSMAFESAETALQPLIHYAEGRLQWDQTTEIVRHGLRKRFRRRLAAAGMMHPFLTGRAGRRVLGIAARGGLLPFQTLMGLVR